MAVEQIQPKNGERVLHLCAGGIDIAKYMPPGINLVEAETNPEFSRISELPLVSPFSLPYESDSFDCVFILANLHHSDREERSRIYREIHRVLKPGGRFVIGDVVRGSKQDRFLNVFVNEHNPFGHKGRFFDESEAEHFRTAGFQSVRTNYPKYSWRFKDHNEMYQFATGLFYLRICETTFRDRIGEYLTVQEREDGLLWRWRLIYFCSTK